MLRRFRAVGGQLCAHDIQDLPSQQAVGRRQEARSSRAAWLLRLSRDQQCAAQETSFKSAMWAFDSKNKVSKKQSESDAAAPDRRFRGVRDGSLRRWRRRLSKMTQAAISASRLSRTSRPRDDVARMRSPLAFEQARVQVTLYGRANSTKRNVRSAARARPHRCPRTAASPMTSASSARFARAQRLFLDDAVPVATHAG